jgi:integrase
MASKLTDKQAQNLEPEDKPLADGSVTGLWLHPGPAKGRGKWILRVVSPEFANRRDMGLGVYPDVGIALARDKALDARRLIMAGKDPIGERKAAKAASRRNANIPTFGEAVRQVHRELEPSWSNTKHAMQWLKTLESYAIPKIGSFRVTELTAPHFAEVLRPIWLNKSRTAARLKQRCHRVMKWCCAHQFISSNPVDNVTHLLPSISNTRERVTHQPAMPWRDIPTFVNTTLRGELTNVAPALLEFIILTAARSGEACAMKWDEVDLRSNLWIIPANRMKMNTNHRVPLSRRAVEIVRGQRQLYPDTELVFPAPRGGVLAGMVLTKFLRDHKAHSSEPGRTATAHGFRSSFRDWASENGYSRDLAERALAHTVKNQVEAAYHRTDLLEQRRPMMEK